MTEWEPTSRMRHAELAELVKLTCPEVRPRRTSEMPTSELDALLAASAPSTIAAESTLPVRPLRYGPSRFALGLSFVAAIAAGIALTVPFWALWAR